MGATVGGYVLESELGRGATGTVFRAVRAGGGEPVALKVLSPALGADPVFRARFVREAEIMKQLTDPHCVGVLEYGDDAGAWIAMEYVHGATLRAVLDSAGKLTAAQACGVLLGALAGLGHAHELGVVHRDVKPENVLVDVEGESKLADFGLVADRVATDDWRAIEGSPAYMSPEQVRGEPLDARADLYACGVVLYELLTGFPPYRGESPVVILHAQVDGPLPDMTSLPEHLAHVVSRVLAKDPDGRPATAAAFAAELADAAERDLGPLWLAGASIAGLVAGILAAHAAGAETLSTTHRRRPGRRILRGRVKIAATVVTVAIVVGTVAIIATRSGGSTHHVASPAPAHVGVASSAPATTPPISKRPSGIKPPSGTWTSPHLTITPNSLGAVQVRMTLDQAQTAAGGLLFDGLGDGSAYPTKGLPGGYPHDYVGLSGTDNTVRCVGAESIDRSTRSPQTISTPEGFQLGDTVQHLLAVYGPRAQHVPPPTQGITSNAGYVVTESGGNLAFVVSGATVVEITGGGSDLGPNSCTG